MLGAGWYVKDGHGPRSLLLQINIKYSNGSSNVITSDKQVSLVMSCMCTDVCDKSIGAELMVLSPMMTFTMENYMMLA